jgi:hypothetical protein
MNTDIFARTIWRGILGIIVEILLVLGFIAAGVIICFLWWRVIR